MAVNDGITFEIIVIDDCSADAATVIENEAINNLPECSFSQNETNLGRTLTRKKLAEKAQYNTLLFLDADVIPVHQDFIKKYGEQVKIDTPVVCGGYAYEDKPVSTDSILRYKYGKNREEKSASERQKNPYSSIFSGNLLIKKELFLQHNYSENRNIYGMDNYFGYQLYIHNIPVTHIDNTIYHLGLESNTIFFKKSLESVKFRKELLADSKGIENINSLLKHYKLLKKYKLTHIVAVSFELIEPLLKKMILSKDPNLFCLDIYRLGYICTLK
jgi:glycosyltransferase involved in cell wall biosynthesis